MDNIHNTDDAQLQPVTIQGNIDSGGGPSFAGYTTLNAEVINFGTKTKRSEFRRFNVHYEVPNNVSVHFTGREDILNELKETLLSPG
ncbi:hypothetical protein H072_8655 [Dactylellina haptotyla CBS 200.50]|uniref:Uncharacterized protein n=1 Tax=Dactylellina haptotyla (strain CBS 200.50) TaxID=1284197 RepID=S8BQU0_DACHA|nr:hypothetical protein H072_8655 [Dactylellina haptotyla CBS 200.50]